MNIHFYKYQATGNDFILIDNRDGELSLNTDQIKKLCDRRFGIGADGLILIEKDPAETFNLIYYNSDGSQSLCGNGSRAATNFAAYLGMFKSKASFMAYDGVHDAELLNADVVRLRMNNVNSIQSFDQDIYLNTGSPHFIRYVNNLDHHPVVEEGRKIRYSEQFASQNGTNVNFVERLPDNTIYVRTYERGVENETLSCGTGVTAAALAASRAGYTSPVKVKTLGGELSVEFKSGQAGAFTDIYLIGPAKMVFQGDLVL
ncbi:MAG: diaminopimelate epimerase [Cyclobacteriaceae bacterium]|nr:diaminopimelate epimerase [Cyclobacteriaceae bacterium]